MKLVEQYGTFDQLIVWTDNAPSQFKASEDCLHCYLYDDTVAVALYSDETRGTVRNIWPAHCLDR